MKTHPALLVCVLATILLGGCNRAKTGAGFYLPVGDPEHGRKAFVDLKCYECHRVEGVELPAPTIEKEAVVLLGGEVTLLRSYGDLVTSIIHPNQRRSEKLVLQPGQTGPKHPMKVFNDQMTVTQMIDLVTFLHPHYRLPPPTYDPTMIR